MSIMRAHAIEGYSAGWLQASACSAHACAHTFHLEAVHVRIGNDPEVGHPRVPEDAGHGEARPRLTHEGHAAFAAARHGAGRHPAHPAHPAHAATHRPAGKIGQLYHLTDGVWVVEHTRRAEVGIVEHICGRIRAKEQIHGEHRSSCEREIRKRLRRESE